MRDTPPNSSGVAVTIEATQPGVRRTRASQDAYGPGLHQLVVSLGLGDEKAEIVARDCGYVFERLFQIFQLLFQMFDLLFQGLYLPNSGVDLSLERGSPRLIPFETGFGGCIEL
jgi:hypothetical protein